jgi:hypothetical protein
VIGLALALGGAVAISLAHEAAKDELPVPDSADDSVVTA